MLKYPNLILTLINQLQQLPGVGKKTAERFVFQILTWEENQLNSLSKNLSLIKQKINFCLNCGCLIEENYCEFCDTTKRNKKIICIVSSPKDVYLINNTNSYNGFFHVIKNLLSPMDDFNENELELTKIKKRIEDNNTIELIIALDSSLEGDATSLYIKQYLSSLPVKISRIAFGIPLGSSLDYIDEGTLCKSFLGRQQF